MLIQNLINQVLFMISKQFRFFDDLNKIVVSETPEKLRLK